MKRLIAVLLIAFGSGVALAAADASLLVGCIVGGLLGGLGPVYLFVSGEGKG